MCLYYNRNIAACKAVHVIVTSRHYLYIYVTIYDRNNFRGKESLHD